MLALLAVQEAAVTASGHGSPLDAPIGSGTVDGFAAGILLSAVVFLLILAQRRALRRSAPKVKTPAPVPEISRPGDSIPINGTHPYADIAPRGGMAAVAEAMTVIEPSPFRGGSPFGDPSNEVVLQSGVRLEEWLEGELRRPSLPKQAATAGAPDATADAPVASADAPVGTAVAPATEPPATEPPATDKSATGMSAEEKKEPAKDAEPAQPRRAPSYQSKHRLDGRPENKPWSDNRRRVARHAAASSRSAGTSKRLGLRQFKLVSAGSH